MKGNTLSYDAGNLEQLISNLIRIGVVVGVDLDAPAVTVDAGGMLSDWLPWGAGRAGAVRKWSPPTIGEEVLVFSPYGDMTQAVIIMALYQDTFPAPSNSATVEMTQYPDGSTVSYDSASNTLTVDVAASGNVIVNCQHATVNSDVDINLNTPDTFCSGNLTVAKMLTYQGGMTGSNSTGGPTGVITGSITVVGGEITVDGIGHKSHHHVEHDGPSTGSAVG
jgi:phage baseplate assembly protein V